MTLQGQNRHIVGWNRKHTVLSVLVLLMQIAFLVLHMLLCLHTVVPYLPLQHAHNVRVSTGTVSVCQHYTVMTRQTRILTFRWKVPSKAATMTVFPKLAISSQNSTVSGNYNTKAAQIKLKRNSSRWIPRLEQRHSGLHGGEQQIGFQINMLGICSIKLGVSKSPKTTL